MNYEQKYKEALERAKKWRNAPNSDKIPTYANRVIEEIFPELKESEDERIVKCLLNYFHHVRYNGLDLKGTDVDEVITWLEKQREQNHADKVEPKFKVGDWISTTLQIVNVDINKELYWFNDGSYLPFADEEYLHLWTIKDAKDGDVLSYVTGEGDLWIMIYWSLYEPYKGHVHYHTLLVNEKFTNKGTCCIYIDNLRPATKEQRELLFQKLKESGYRWDEDKKEVIRYERFVSRTEG